MELGKQLVKTTTRPWFGLCLAVVSILSSPSMTSASFVDANAAGSKCTKVGQTKRDAKKNVSVKCTKQGKLLVWVVVSTKPSRGSTGSSTWKPFAGDPCDGLRKDLIPTEHQWYRTDNTLVLSSDGSAIYVNVEHIGFLKSVDDGLTWKRVVDGIVVDLVDPQTGSNCYGEYQMAIADPTNPQRMLLATGAGGYLTSNMAHGGGIYETTTGGTKWRQMISNTMNTNVGQQSLVMDPTNPKVIYYGTSAAPASYNEADPNIIFVKKGLIYKTTDGGASWTELPTEFKKYERLVSILIDPSNPLVLTAGSVLMTPDPNRGPNITHQHPRSLIQSIDGGNSWSPIGNLPGWAKAVVGLWGSTNNGKNMFINPSGYAPTFADDGSFVSTDRGQTWQQTFRMDVVIYDPTDKTGNRMIGYKQDNCAPSGCRKVLWQSSDAGLTWQAHGSLPIEILDLSSHKERVSSIIFDPRNTNIIYMSGANGYVWKSIDRGVSWMTLLSLEKVRQQIR